MTMVNTPDGIAAIRAITLRIALEAQVKGLNVIGHGMTGTSVAKRDYGLKGQARTILPVVTAYTEAITTLRESSREDMGRRSDLFNLLGMRVSENVASNFGDDGIRKAFSLELNGLMEDTALTSEDVDVLNALLTITLFERNAKPSVRVVFRED